MAKIGDVFLPQFLYDENLTKNDAETENGLHLNNIYLPKEIIFHILTFVDPKELLKCSLVCRNWNKFIKSYALWSKIYRRRYYNKAKYLPWYLFYCLFTTTYFNTNMLLNGNGQHKYDHWQFLRNSVRCKIENPPDGADPLPLGVPEFYNNTSCFAICFDTCCKRQNIKLSKGRLFQYILKTYKPHIYLSEWLASRYDCGCIYKLQCGFIRNVESGIQSHTPLVKPYAVRVKRRKDSKWEKIEIAITEYPEDIEELTFEHEGHDTQVWAGNYGCKIAGGVLKLLFDSMEPLPVDKNGIAKPKVFSEIKYDTNGEKDVDYDCYDGEDDDDSGGDEYEIIQLN